MHVRSYKSKLPFLISADPSFSIFKELGVFTGFFCSLSFFGVALVGVAGRSMLSLMDRLLKSDMWMMALWGRNEVLTPTMYVCLLSAVRGVMRWTAAGSSRLSRSYYR